MKTMILVALAVLSLGVGNAYAQGKPLSSHTGVYGSQYEEEIDFATGRNPSRSRIFIEGGSAAGRIERVEALQLEKPHAPSYSFCSCSCWRSGNDISEFCWFSSSSDV